MDSNFYKDVLEAIADGVYFIDLNQKITYWNKAAERISGYAAEEVLGKSCADNTLKHVDSLGTELCVDGCPLAATIADGKPREADVFMHHKLGHRLPVSVRATPILDELGTVVGAVEVFRDNSKQHNLLEELEVLRNEVLTDPLTGIGNRRYAEISMANLDMNMEQSQVPFGVLFADIDHFKRINDTWGHDVGDRVLQMVAKTMSGVLRKLDVACRWGGEEFIILVPNIGRDTLVQIGERLRMLVENSWLDVGDKQVQVTVSLGCALSHPGESAASVLSRADNQLYASKDCGRNCVTFE